MIATLFVIGQCLRLLNQDPWATKTHRIIDVGSISYQTSAMYKPGWLWEDAGFDFIMFKAVNEYALVPCGSNYRE